MFREIRKKRNKVDALRVCDKVCFTVYGNETIREEAWAPFMQSTVVFGRCHLMENSSEKAMEMLNRVYAGMFLSQNVEMSDDDYEEFIKMAARGFDDSKTMVSSPDMKFEPANIVFRFPKD